MSGLDGVASVSCSLYSRSGDDGGMGASSSTADKLGFDGGVWAIWVQKYIQTRILDGYFRATCS